MAVFYTSGGASWFQSLLLGVSKIYDDGTLQDSKPGLNFIGFSITENPGLGAYDVEALVGGGLTLTEVLTEGADGGGLAMTNLASVSINDAPSAAAHATRKDYADGLITTHVGVTDPHTAYALADGTRAFTGAVTAPRVDFSGEQDVTLVAATTTDLPLNDGTTHLRIVTGTANWVIESIASAAGYVEGRRLLVDNIGTKPFILETDTLAGGTALARFELFGDEAYTVGPGERIWLYYSTTHARWTLENGPGVSVKSFRDSHRFELGASQSLTLGTATASGGTLVATYGLEEDYAYNVTVAVHGKQETTNYIFTYLGRATVFRNTGGSALLVEGSDTEVQLELTDSSDGSQQDASNITVVLDVNSNDFRVTITNNDGSNDLAMTTSGIAIGVHRFEIEPDP